MQCIRCGLLLQLSLVAWSVCLSVCAMVTVMYCTKMAEAIAMPYGMESRYPLKENNFGELFSPMRVSAALYAAKKITQSSMTAWLAMRSFTKIVKIVWSLVWTLLARTASKTAEAIAMPYGMESIYPLKENNFGELFSPIRVSAALYAAKKNHSIVNDGMTCDAVFYQNCLITCLNVISPHGIAMPKGLHFTAVVFSFLFFLPSFFRYLIFEVTEQISTKLWYIFTYDCYLINLVRTPPGIYPHGMGQKRFLGTDFELLQNIFLQRNLISTIWKQFVNLYRLPYMLSKFGKL